MTEADFEKILDACKPVPAIMLHIGGGPRSPQQNANDAWAELGSRMGFDGMTVQPSDKGKLFFTAVPTMTAPQREALEERQREETRQKEINQLRHLQTGNTCKTPTLSAPGKGWRCISHLEPAEKEQAPALRGPVLNSREDVEKMLADEERCQKEERENEAQNMMELGPPNAHLHAKPTWKLPEPPAGREWHRVDGWAEEMLPDGMRPLLMNEECQFGDEYYLLSERWYPLSGGYPTESTYKHTRTSRPLPPPPSPEPPEGYALATEAEMDCLPSVPMFIHKHVGIVGDSWSLSPNWHKGERITPDCRKHYHYAIPLPVKAKLFVPLDETDVPPGTVFRDLGEQPAVAFWTPRMIAANGVTLREDELDWRYLFNGPTMEMKRPGEEWQRCRKLQTKQPA